MLKHGGGPAFAALFGAGLWVAVIWLAVWLLSGCTIGNVSVGPETGVVVAIYSDVVVMQGRAMPAPASRWGAQ